MSEFSESYHLEADDQQAGLHLLQRARLEGFVFPPERGWVSILPRSEFGETPDALVEANQRWLLHYLLDQDAGWMFASTTGRSSPPATSAAGLTCAPGTAGSRSTPAAWTSR
jgi:hypothetical protein